MRYGFIKLKNDDGSLLYMEPRDFERYKNIDVFNNHAESLVVIDHVYIGAFPLIFPMDEIIKYNDDAIIKDEISLSDLAFKFNSISTVAHNLDCDNAFSLY